MFVITFVITFVVLVLVACTCALCSPKRDRRNRRKVAKEYDRP